MTARLAVIMTVYNGEPHLFDAISSLLSQTYREFELYLINDGSSDNSLCIMKQAAKGDQRITIYDKGNSGIVGSLNEVIPHVQAEFIARADADDISDPERFARQISYLDAEPDVLAVSGKGRQIDINGFDLGSYTFTGDPELSDASMVPAREPYLMQPFLMVRTAALKRVGGYRVFPVSEDSDLYWRLSEVGRLAHLDLQFGLYRLNPNGISSQSAASGRLMCACSQLAALSARRRAQGHADLPISSALFKRLEPFVGSLAALADALRGDLSASEMIWFRASIGAKMLEMAGFRPYELETEDSRFIASAIDAMFHSITRTNRALIGRMRTGTAARLLSKGRIEVARPLITYRNLIPVLARLCARIAIPRTLYQVVRGKLTDSSATVK